MAKSHLQKSHAEFRKGSTEQLVVYDRLILTAATTRSGYTELLQLLQ